MRDSITLLEDDTRAVASLLGFVLLFGIAVIGFSMYQAYAVPDQNAQTEFQHFEEAKDQMVAFRSAAIDTASDDIPRSVTFDLGTRFQQRYLAVNPPPPTGTLETSDRYNITVTHRSGAETNVSAQFLRFDPHYREYQPGELWYEHGIVYVDAREMDGGVALLAGGRAEEFPLAPIQNEFARTGQQRLSLELYAPSETNIRLDNIENITIPTRLNEHQWKEEIGLTEEDIEQPPADGSKVSTITIDSDAVSDITPIGLRDPPESANSTADYEPGGPLTPPSDGPIVFTDSSARLFSITDGGDRTDYDYNGSQVIGPKTADVDGDGRSEIPVVNRDGELQFVDMESVSSPPSEGGQSNKPKKANSLMTVGQWNGSASSVFFAGNDNKIYRANENSEELVDRLTGNSKADAVLGIADIDGDETEELVYGGKGPDGNSDTVNYIDGPDGAVESIPSSGYGTNKAPGVGTPADFDGDGQSLVPIVDGSNNIKLFDASGRVKTISGISATKAPITTTDVDEDGAPEIVYISSSKIKFIDDVRSDSPAFEFVRNNDGEKVQASTERGVS